LDLLLPELNVLYRTALAELPRAHWEFAEQCGYWSRMIRGALPPRTVTRALSGGTDPTARDAQTEATTDPATKIVDAARTRVTFCQRLAFSFALPLQPMNFPRAALAAFVFCVVALALQASIGTSLQMQLGNPNGAVVDPNNHANYLIQRPQYALDYNDTTRDPNWVSWDLTSGDHGSVARSDFVPDPDLPAVFYPVTTDDYNGVGAINFNRGHMTPSADRNDTVANNVPAST
jgi:hypothetical protein